MILLGLRLARAGGAVRVAALLLGGLLSVVLLGLAWGLPDALYPLYENPIEPGQWLAPPERGAAVAMSALMLAPVLMLLVAAGRMSAVIRDQRLVSLRLIGVSKARTLLAAAVENVSVTVVGALAGLGLLHLIAPVVDSRLPVAQGFALARWQWVLLVVGVVGLSGLLALASARTLQLLPTQARRGGIAKTPSWARVLPVLVALACFVVVITERPDLSAVTRSHVFIAGVIASALGIAAAPALVPRYSSTVLRGSRSLSLTMAGRGIEADPTSASRRVAAVGIGLFVMFITAGVVNSWESVSQSRHAVFNAEVGPQEVHVLGMQDDTGARPPITAADRDALAAVPGVIDVISDYDLVPDTFDESTGDGWFDAFVGSCEQLALVAEVADCSNTAAAWLEPSHLSAEGGTAPPTVTLLARTWSGEEAGRARIEVPGVITVDWQRMSDMRGYPPQESLFVPEHLIADLDLTPRALRVVGPAGQDFVTTLGVAAAELGLEAHAWSYQDYASLVSVRTMVGSAAAALVAVVVLIVTLSILDWVRETRRPRMWLFAIGVPRGVVARAYLLQFGIPLTGALVLGGLLGWVGFRAYAVLGERGGMGLALPTTYWWLVGTLMAGVVAGASVAGLAAGERMRALDLRQE